MRKNTADGSWKPAYEKYWDNLCRQGDPLAVPNKFASSFRAGWDAAHADDLLEALKQLVGTLQKFGDWDDGCFYYNRRAASELQTPLTVAREAIAKVEGESK